MQIKRFHLDKVKIYLDGVFAKERNLNTYAKCADKVYEEYSYDCWITVRHVESWLRNNCKLKVETNPYRISELADKFSVDISSLTSGKNRTEKDVYYWALATAIWIYGGMSNFNPLFRGL
jgi:hypothetical protein